ncbi:Crp/Fnr family transcriptional regulator [Olivibacter domesticus]|uniref:cAMP-binding domain of CRP or a regulatory subunit of cAMP-dependent protein kinases n=1 Tax=Olivibacter domesticus TaxID=407022 RepID=A0A1H7SAA6_OLID1|nr:Crp/Fnr family transcriptional regulator [Olivibacter domesticus]SEL69562.1 cAMP-binding domain of CRP or a regulatory subunit of cAMP-dependent protein kinases [Olivibacter domesticus]
MEALTTAIKSFIRLSTEEEKLISTLFREMELKPGEYFLEEGKVCKYVAFVVKGLLRFYINDDGEEKTGYFSNEGDFLSYYPSFLTQTVADKYIQALEPTKLFVIDYDRLQHLYKNIQEGERFGRLAIEQVYLSAVRQLDSFYNDPPEKRYQQFLNTYPNLVQRIPQYYIASYVGIKPQSLSRIRKRLVKKH